MDRFDLGILRILWSETAAYIGIYAVYALIVCSVIQYIEYRNEQPQLGFTGILIANVTIFFTALILFTLAMAGYWFGLRIFGSEIIFAWVTYLVLLGSVHEVSILMQNVTGNILKKSKKYASLTAFFLSIPFFVVAVFMTMISFADFRH